MRRILSFILALIVFMSTIVVSVDVKAEEVSGIDFEADINKLLQTTDAVYSFDNLMNGGYSVRAGGDENQVHPHNYFADYSFLPTVKISGEPFKTGPAFIIQCLYTLMDRSNDKVLTDAESALLTTIVDGINSKPQTGTTLTFSSTEGEPYKVIAVSSKHGNMWIETGVREAKTGGTDSSLSMECAFKIHYGSKVEVSDESTGFITVYKNGLFDFTDQTALVPIKKDFKLGSTPGEDKPELKVSENVKQYLTALHTGLNLEKTAGDSELTTQAQFAYYMLNLPETLTSYDKVYIAIMSAVLNDEYYYIENKEDVKEADPLRGKVVFRSGIVPLKKDNALSTLFGSLNEKDYQKVFALVSILKNKLSKVITLSGTNDYELLLTALKGNSLYKNDVTWAADGKDDKTLIAEVNPFTLTKATVASPSAKTTAYYFEEAMMFLSVMVAGGVEVEVNETVNKKENEFEKPEFYNNIFYDPDSASSELLDAIAVTPVVPDIKHIKTEKSLESTNEALAKYYGTMNVVLAYLAVPAYSKYVYDVDKDTYSHPTLEDIVTRMAGGEDQETLKASLTTDQIEDINITVSVYKGLKYLKLTKEDFLNSVLIQQVMDYGAKLEELNLTKSTMQFSEDTAFPLGILINMADKVLNPQIINGIALSATYQPFTTNLYSPDSVIYLDGYEDFIKEFFYKFGFNRKLLFKDTSINAVTNRTFDIANALSTEPITLSDFLNEEGEMSLYIDPSFYNETFLLNQYGEDIDLEGAGFKTEKEAKNVSTFGVPTVNNILKDKPYVNYFEGSPSKLLASKIGFFIMGMKVDDAFSSMTYNMETALLPVKSFYTDSAYKTLINEKNKRPEPVFESSDKTINRPRADRTDFGVYLNHILKHNLKKMSLAPSVYIDMDKPIYMDTFGNIVTESGYVVVPSISNATLFKKEGFDVYNTAFLMSYNAYGYNHKFDQSNKNILDLMNSYFWFDEINKEWLLNDAEINDLLYTFSEFKNNDKTTQKNLVVLNVNRLNSNIDFPRFVYIISEVMRGCPIEAMDTGEYASLVGANPDYLKLSAIKTLTGIMDVILKVPFLLMGKDIIDFTSADTLLNIISGMILIYTLLFTIFLLVFVFREMIKGTAWYVVIFKSVITIAASIALAVALPLIITNIKNDVPAKILSSSTIDLTLLKNQQEIFGGTVGLSNTIEANTDISQFLIKAETAKMNWPALIRDAFNRNAVSYEDYMKWGEINAVSQKDLIQKDNSLYFDVQQLFDSRMLRLNYSKHFLYSQQLVGSSADFYMPYFYVYDKILSDMNNLNMNQGYQRYVLIPTSRGNVTKGMLKLYVNDLIALKSEDPTGLRMLYGLNGLEEVVDESEMAEQDEAYTDLVATYEHSQFYVRDYYTDDQLDKKITEIEKAMYKYISTKINIIDNSIDESIIESVALFVALEHNRTFGVKSTNAIELSNVSPKMIVMSIISGTDLVKNPELSFNKLLYESCKFFQVLLLLPIVLELAMLNGINNIFVLLLITFGIITALVRYIFKNDSDLAKGLAYTIQSVMTILIIFAFAVKLSLMIGGWFNSITISLILVNVVLIADIWLLTKVFKLITKDMSNLGFAAFDKLRGDSFDKIRRKLSEGVPKQVSDVLQKEKGYNRGLVPSRKYTENFIGGEEATSENLINSYKKNSREFRLKEKESKGRRK